MSPWWSKSSLKEAKKKLKKKANRGSIFGLIRRKLKSPESKQISSRRCSEIASKMGSNSRASSPENPVARSQNFAEAHPRPLPEHLSSMGQIDSGKRVSRNRRSSKGLSPFLPKYNHTQNGHDHIDLEGNLATDSVSTDSASDSDSYDPSDFRFIIPQASNYKTSTDSPSSCVTYVTQNKMEKPKPVKACVSNMANLQIPQSSGFFCAPDRSMFSPSRSPMTVFGPELLGPCSSPGSGQNSSHNVVGGETATQLFWKRNRYTPVLSPIPSPRLTSPGPSLRIQSGPVSPLHPWDGGSNMGPSANWPGDAGNGNQRTHRLPLPPLALSNTAHYSPPYSTRTTPMVPKGLGRADFLANHGSGWKKGRLLGSGTFGHVYLGFNSEMGEMCAMKEVTLFSDDARSKESAQQLGQEIALLSHLRHPNIVEYYGSESVDDKLYVYLEYVSGGSIYKLLQEYGEFGELAIKSYTRQILSGIAYLHSTNTVHRDIKGANILVDPSGCVKLADFGVAKHISGPSCSLSFKGSAHWMAPEIINNNPSGCNLVVDIWSLGCTVIEMATTKPPWSQYESVAALFKVGNMETIKEIPDHLSDDAKDFILQCLQWAPSHRPSAAQLLDHPFVKDIASSERFMSPITTAMRSLGIGHASEGVSVPHMGSPLLHSRTGQNINGRLSPSPRSSPRTVLGSPTPLTRAAAGGAAPSYPQVQKPYTPNFTGLTSSSRSPTRSFSPPSNGLHILNPVHDMFRVMPQGSPFFQETVPLDNDFLGNKKKRMSGKSVLVDHSSQQISRDHINQHPLVGQRE